VSSLRACAGLVALQVLGLLAVAVVLVVELFVATPDDPARALVAVLLVLVAAVGLALVVRGLTRGRRWARAPAVVTNLLVLPVAFDVARGDRWYVGVPLLLWALAVLALLVAPSTDAQLGD